MKKSRGSIRLVLILALSLVIIAGCTIEDPSVKEPVSQGTQSAEKETGGDHVTSPVESENDPVEKPLLPGKKFPEGASGARRTLGTILSLDPLQMSLSAEEDLARYLFGSLYMMQGNVETGLPEYTAYHAGSMPETTDYKNYTIELRKGMTWSDGTPITAQDYVDSLEFLLDPRLAHPAGQRFTASLPVRGAENFRTGLTQDFEALGFQAGGEYTLEISLEYLRTPLDVSKAFSLPFLIHRGTYEKSLKDGGERSTYGDAWKKLVYSGPYTLADYDKGKSIRLEKRRDPVLASYDTEYFATDHIWLRSIPDRTEALKEFQEGWLDAIPVAGGSYSYLKEDPRLQEASSNTVWGLYVNTMTGSEILKDPNFRQALYYGIDRTRIAVSMFGAHSSYSGFIGPLTMVQRSVVQLEVPGSGTTPDELTIPGDEIQPDESTPGTETQGTSTVPVRETLTWEPLVYRSTDQSRNLVPKANVVDEKLALKFAEKATAGLTEVQIIELTVPGGGQFSDMAAFLKQSIERLFGQELIQVTIRELPQKESHAALLSGDFDLGFGGMGQDLFDPWASLAVYTTDYGEKFNTFSHPRFDELYQAGYEGRFFRDHSQYMAALQEMEEILLQELPMIPLFVDHGAWLVDPRLKLPFKEPIPGAGLSLDRIKRLD